MEESFGQHFQNAYGDNGKTSYLKAHYDVTGFCPGNERLNGNILCRFNNVVTVAINKQTVLPKAIVFVMENDILNSLNHFKPGISLLIGKSLEWLLNQVHRMITTYKEKLPSKSRKFKYPAILWCSLPMHEYWSKGKLGEFRAKFNFSLKNTVSIFREMDMLNIQWNGADTSLFTRGVLNAKGLTTYWACLNEAFAVWDREQMKLAKTAQPVLHKPSCGKMKTPNRYREEVATAGKFKWSVEKTRFKLPKPQHM